MPRICYVQKNFRADSQELIERVNEVIESYQAQGYNLTLRQVYYQMVARAIIPNNERSYKNLGGLINDARLAGLIDWEAIEDRTRNLKENSHWNTPGDIISSAAYSYHLNHWKGQKNYVEVWVEKDALASIVGQICGKLDVPWFSCRGYVSQSEMWAAARKRLVPQERVGKNVTLLHLGDHDPSGRDMSRDIEERLTLFGVRNLDFQRIALNMDQINLYNPPPNPTKVSDSRAVEYISQFGYECWELDALEPKVISDLIEEHVKPLRNEKLYQEIVRREEEEKALLSELAVNWDNISENWEEIKEDYCQAPEEDPE
jgi:hypothetical protein